ncbi:hypothetical protein FRB94_011329 [Tulasnella sp. JGI-2019a]|nr:hypothetical protein FRB93_009331 [Tulasnella sp. JGI-2019a]KAG9009883.1 hypothetical protein FRB94_011329 [Tulasnella sp. JGI-2019a]KAG9034674.1 hypothetical protein FRB95_012859 [Tulasnella sp. JGI-2019a]
MLLPAFLTVFYAIDCILIVVTDFRMAYRSDDPKYAAIYVWLWIAVLGLAIVNTAYVTLFIVGRLWRVGSATNKVASPQEVKKNHYQGAINAIVQSGAIHSAALVVYVVALGSGSITFQMAVRSMCSDANSIASTLLFLQLDLFQEQAKPAGAHEQPLTTGATVEFTPQRRTSSGEEECPQVAAPAPRLRRTSMPTYLHRDSGKDAMYQLAPSPLPVTLVQRKVGNQSLFDDRAGASRPDDESFHEKKELAATTT